MHIKKSLFLLILVFASFWIIFVGLQNDTIFDESLGRICNNWENINGERKLVDQPFTEVDNENYVRWDAVHYKLIKDNWYSVELAGGEYIYAFFPLFPLIWKFSFLPPLGILFLNYSFFVIAILIFSNLLSSTKSYINNILIACSLPSLIVFFIPYTEATFLLMSAIGTYGFVRKKYAVFFIGFLLASLTRSAYVFIVLSFICAELFFFFEHKKIMTLLKNTFLRIAPLLIGTAIASIVQLISGSSSLTTFIDVQETWEHVLGMPHHLRDWSQESFSMNIGVLILILIPIVAFTVQKALTQLKKIKEPATTEVEDRKYYLVILSLCYLVLLTLFIIFFQGGNLHTLYRYTISTPFFYILLFAAYPLVVDLAKNFKSFTISVLSLIAVFILGLADFSTEWNFCDMGLFLIILSCIFWLFQEHSTKRIYKYSLYASILLNLVWTCYLFNSYIVDAWIFV